MSLRILKPGLLSTVQDGGRHGLQHIGIVPGGAMDPVAHALGNALVGNRGDEATLEITLIGPEMVFETGALIALCGADFDARADGRPLPLNRPVLLRPGTRVAAGRALLGCRAYLALAGGIAVKPVLGSRSTYLPARFGGLQGCALRPGDVLPLAADAAALSANRYAALRKAALQSGVQTVRWSAPPMTLPRKAPVVVHAMEGRHFGGFRPASRRALFEATWRVAPESDRMGFRLRGPALARAKSDEILSGPTCLGTLQVPAGGAPIALMADHQTSGGYPTIAEIASADVPRLAQLAPGGAVRFARCTLDEALRLRRALRARLAQALGAIAREYGA